MANPKLFAFLFLTALSLSAVSGISGAKNTVLARRLLQAPSLPGLPGLPGMPGLTNPTLPDPSTIPPGFFSSFPFPFAQGPPAFPGLPSNSPPATASTTTTTTTP